MSFFSSDDSLHREEDQLKRIKSALKLKMDSVDFETQTGHIKDYDVSLDRCTCMDFGRRRKPCKHIYRLAIELGVFNADSNNPKTISNPPSTKGTSHNNSHSYPSTGVFSCYQPVPKSFTVIDFETANTCPDSICQIGIVVVKDNLIVDRKSFLVCPPYTEFTFTDIHGITFDDVKDKPKFDVLWHLLKKYVEGHTIAAYNLSFDLNCFFSVLSRYNIPCPKFNAFDILANVHACRYFDCELSELKNYKLVTVAKKLGLEHRAHDAFSDSTVTAQIQIYLSKVIPDENTLVYFSNLSALTEAISKNQISFSAIGSYCDELLKGVAQINYDEYKEFFKLVEQIAAHHDSASLYKYCGMFYEKTNRVPRALSLYKNALSLNEKIGVKGKIQKLEKELRS